MDKLYYRVRAYEKKVEYTNGEGKTKFMCLVDTPNLEFKEVFDLLGRIWNTVKEHKLIVIVGFDTGALAYEKKITDE